MPYFPGPILIAYQLIVAASRSASGWADFRNSSTSFSLPGLASSCAQMASFPIVFPPLDLMRVTHEFRSGWPVTDFLGLLRHHFTPIPCTHLRNLVNALELVQSCGGSQNRTDEAIELSKTVSFIARRAFCRVGGQRFCKILFPCLVGAPAVLDGRVQAPESAQPFVSALQQVAGK